MKVILVSEVEIKYTVISLESKNAAGYDGISNKILKHFMNCINKPSTYICNFSLTTGIFLESSKFAIAQPICKKGEETAKSHCRPISLLIALSKILKIVLFKRLDQRLESNNSLAIEQFGFRKVVNTESAIFILTVNIVTSLNQ